MKEQKFCIIQVPSEAVFFGRIGAKLPPLSLGILAGYLRTHDIDLDMFDLATSVDVFGENTNIEKLAKFYDKEKVYDYIEGGNNAFFDEFAKNALIGIDWDKYDIVGISQGNSLLLQDQQCF